MGHSKRKNQLAQKPRPSVGQSITVYGGFIYKTLEYFGISGADIIEWLQTLPHKLPDIWHIIQGLI